MCLRVAVRPSLGQGLCKEEAVMAGVNEHRSRGGWWEWGEP